MSANIRRKTTSDGPSVARDHLPLHCLCGELVGRAVVLSAAGSDPVVPRAFCLRTDCVVPYALGTVIRGVTLPPGAGPTAPSSVDVGLGGGAAGGGDGAAGASGSPSGSPHGGADLAARVVALEEDMMRAKCLILCLHEQLQAQGPKGGAGADSGPPVGGRAGLAPASGCGGPSSPVPVGQGDDDFVSGSASKRRR